LYDYTQRNLLKISNESRGGVIDVKKARINVLNIQEHCEKH